MKLEDRHVAILAAAILNNGRSWPSTNDTTMTANTLYNWLKEKKTIDDGESKHNK